MDPVEQALDAWKIHGRINIYLLDAIPADALTTPLVKGKSVGSQFAHIHAVRLMWIKAAEPDLLEGLVKVEGTASKEEIRAALASSDIAILELLSRGLERGKVKNFKPHPIAFLGYLIAHESNHRGHAELALRQAGIPLPDKIGYGIWEWGSR